VSTGVMFRCPLPSSDTFAARLVSVPVSPVAQSPGNRCPGTGRRRRRSRLGRLPSPLARVQPAEGGGAVLANADSDGTATSRMATVRLTASTIMPPAVQGGYGTPAGGPGQPSGRPASARDRASPAARFTRTGRRPVLC